MFESLHYLLESSLIVRIYLAKFESYQIKDKILIRIISGYFKSRRYRRLLKFASTLVRLVHLLIHLQVHLGVHLVNLQFFMKLLRDLCQIIIDNIFEKYII